MNIKSCTFSADYVSLEDIVRLSDWSCSDHLSKALYLQVSIDLLSNISTWFTWSILPSIVLQKVKITSITYEQQYADRLKILFCHGL